MKPHPSLLGIVLIILTACDGDSPDASERLPSAAPPSSAEVPAADLARQQAVASYREMWKAFAQAGTTSDWQSAGLAQHASGAALDKLSRSLYSDHYKGFVTKGEPVLAPRASTAEPPDAPTKVTLTDCGDSTNWLKYRKDTGEPADDKPGGRRLIKAIVEEQPDGSWKVTDYGVHGVGTC